jgi:hypothetical protein
VRKGANEGDNGAWDGDRWIMVERPERGVTRRTLQGNKGVAGVVHAYLLPMAHGCGPLVALWARTRLCACLRTWTLQACGSAVAQTPPARSVRSPSPHSTPPSRLRTHQLHPCSSPLIRGPRCVARASVVATLQAPTLDTRGDAGACSGCETVRSCAMDRR